MDMNKRQEEQEWLREQLDKFTKVLPKYQTCAVVLQTVLDKAIKKYSPLAIVQTRPKSIVSFGEKALLKKHANRYSAPIDRMTDLCGGRIIVPTLAEVEVICEFIKNHFEIDWENTVDLSKRLKPTEFGYRGVHYIVKFKTGVFPTKEINVRIPDEIFGLRAEIQVKTILEYAWGVFTHDRAYKGSFKIPEKWQRELANLAATLESADSSFARVEDGLRGYAASYGAYMTKEQMQDQVKNLKIVLEHDPTNAALASRIGKLAITLGDWQTAIDILSRYVDSGYQPILRDLGVAMCKLYRDKPNSKEYKKGQSYLEAAIAMDPKDTDAISSYAGTYKGIDEDKVRALYRQAFDVDPSDPYPLGNYLECEVSNTQNISVVSTLRTVIDNAIKRCRDQADVGMNLPWAFYNMGKFYLLLGNPHESLASYAKAVQLGHADWLINTSLQSLEKLNIVRDALPGYDWVRRLLLIGLSIKFPAEQSGKEAIQQLKKLSSDSHKLLAGPIVIVAGGCDPTTEIQIQGYRQVTIEGFRDFRGTIISGGTAAGVSGLATEIGSKYPDDIKTVGYIPRGLPAGVRKDKRYRELRSTDGTDFSPLEPLQYWTDIISSSIPLPLIKVVGINGGVISAAEYRIALTLGAQVAVLEDSGGEAAKIIMDDDWAKAKKLICLPVDSMTIAAFIGGSRPRLESEIRKIIARAIHENYRQGKTRVSTTDDPASAPWDKLPDNLKESNRQQADDIFSKLLRIRCTVVKVIGRKAVKMTFTKDEVEIMAEMEHGRWNVERLLDGWKPGEKRDVDNKISPSLTSWNKLPEDVKEWDRDTVRKIPEFLAKVGLEIQRQT